MWKMQEHFSTYLLDPCSRNPPYDSTAGCERWRPTVLMTQHEDLLIRRMALLHNRKYKAITKHAVWQEDYEFLFASFKYF
jgi:Regulator of RNA terminal phosphate cyclase